MKRMISGVAVCCVLTCTLLLGTGTARAAWQQISRILSLQGAPVPASANILSEHELEVLDSMSAQSQAELLLERSIKFRGCVARCADS